MLLRVARPTNDLRPLERFYVEGVGLTVRSRFAAHAGFDGLILASDAWEVEFVTLPAGHAPAPRAPTAEHLLALFLSPAEVALRAARLDALGFPRVTPQNPWWAQHGVTFEDPDGYPFVLARLEAPAFRGPPAGALIRLARESDVPALETLHARVWDEDTTPTVAPPAAAVDPVRQTFVAELGGEVVGAVQVGPRTSLATNAHVAVLAWLAVSPEHQRLGLGRALCEHAITTARTRGFAKLALNVLASNTHAVTLYRSLGFQLEARRAREFLLRGRLVDALEFALMLS